MHDVKTIQEKLHCFRMKAHDMQTLCTEMGCPYHCSYDEISLPYCAYNGLLADTEKALKAQREAWCELRETITEMRDNGGTGDQQGVCRFLANLMKVIEERANNEIG